MARTYRKTDTTDKTSSRATKEKSTSKSSRSTSMPKSTSTPTTVPKTRMREGRVRRQKKEDVTNDVAMSVAWAKGDKW